LITCSAYALRAGIDDGLAEFGVNEKIEVSMTICTPPIMVINIHLFIVSNSDQTSTNLKSF